MAKKLNIDSEIIAGNETETSDNKTSGSGVKVVNVPHKKKPLQTPSNIIRIIMMCCFLLCIYLLCLPFLHMRLFITEDLGVTLFPDEAYVQLATQDEVNKASKAISDAINSLEKKKDSDEESDIKPAQDTLFFSNIGSAQYYWSTYAADNVKTDELIKLVDEGSDIDRKLYTPESAEKLNKAVLNGRKTLCSNVLITQTGFQMIFGGTIGEAYGNDQAPGTIILHSLFAALLGIAPLICFFAFAFDKHRNIKHIICGISSLLCLADIMLTIYPYIGSGAVYSIVLYIIIILLLFFSFYAKQQEDYIVSHPELEAEFTEKHSHFVKALINAKSFGKTEHLLTKKEREAASAVNAKKKREKNKSKKH